jgi:BioD-like phosphotransacetylase family protein
MDKFVVTSIRPSAGKTSLIIGITKALNRSIGYMKPFGERFLYRKKRLWDYDAALITQIFSLHENPEDMSIGFHHSKLLFMLDEAATRERLHEVLASVAEGKEIFFAECGRDITYGASVHLDALSLARHLDAELIVIASGHEDTILDDLIFFKRYLHLSGVRFKGVIINMVANLADFRETRLPLIMKTGLNVLGVIPYDPELPCFSVTYLADRLFAGIITGEANLNRSVKHIFIGSMSAGAALQSPMFQEKGKLIITSGDRSDMIAAALESDTAAVILTNNILPPADLIAKATGRGIPLLLVKGDTYEIARQIEGLESLPTKDDADKIARIEQMVRAHVDLGALLAAGGRS